MKRPLKKEALKRLQKALNAIPELKNMGGHSAEFEKWRRNTEVVIANTFGGESRHVIIFHTQCQISS